MRWVLAGVTVTVLKPVQSSTDPFGAPVPGEPEKVEVGNVLVDNPTAEEVEQTTRQHGAVCDLKLHFPKTYRGDLRGCSVVLPEPWPSPYEVIGDPMPYDPELTPGEHDRPVLVRRVVG